MRRLLSGQLFEGEQQQPFGIALKLLDPFPVFFLLDLLSGLPLLVLGKPLPRDGAGFHQIIPQSSALEIEFSTHEQLSGLLDSFLGELRQEGVCEVSSNAFILLLPQQVKTLLHGEIGVDVFQRPGGVDAKMARSCGVSLGNRFQHSGRADSGQCLGAFLVEKVAAILKELGDEQGNSRFQTEPVQPAAPTRGSIHFIG